MEICGSGFSELHSIAMPAYPKKMSVASGTTDRGARSHPYCRVVRPGEVITYQPNGGVVYCPRPRRIIKHKQWDMELFEQYLLPRERRATAINKQIPASSFQNAKGSDSFQFPQQSQHSTGSKTRDQMAPSPIYETPHYPYLLQPLAKNIQTHQASLTASVGRTSSSNWSIPGPLVTKIHHQYRMQQKKNSPKLPEVTIITEDKGYDGDVEEAYRMGREVLNLEHAIRYYQFRDRHIALNA